MSAAPPERALLLDLDGTLADTIPFLYDVYLEFLRRHGKEGRREEFDALNGPPLNEVVHSLAATHGLEAPVEELTRTYRHLIEMGYAVGARLVPGARELLARARARGIAVALVTSAPERLAEGFLSAHAVRDAFAAIVTSEGLPRGKPDPAIFRRALETLGAAAEEALVVEDSPSTLAGARAAGIRALLVGDDRDPGGRLAGALAAIGGPEPTITRAGPRLVIVENGRDPARDAAALARAEEVWERARAERPSLVDGRILAFVAREGDVVRGRFERYRHYLAQRRDPRTCSFGILPLATSGVLLADDAVAIGRRARDVTQYPGWLELAPSGGIDDARRRPDGTIDYVGQLLVELEEETGVSRDRVRRVEPFGLVETPDVIDIACVIELGSREPLSSREYDRLDWVALADLPAFLAAHAPGVVPSSRTLLEALGLLRRDQRVPPSS